MKKTFLAGLVTGGTLALCCHLSDAQDLPLSRKARPTLQQSSASVSWREDYYSGAPLEIGNRPQFFFDDYIIEDSYGLKKVLGPVEKYADNPIFKGGEISFKDGVSVDCGPLTHVIYDPVEKMYKGWYLGYRREKTYNYSTLYAESKDGYTWKKPELDFFTFGGKKSNVVLHDDNETALLEEIKLDTNAKDADKRFVGLVKMLPPGETTRCIVLMYSPDGRKWALAPDPVLFRGASDGSYSLVKDEIQNRWMLYRRPATNAMVRPAEGAYNTNPLRPEKKGLNIKRRFGVTMSSDMKDWTYPRGIEILDEADEISDIIGNKMDVDWATVTRFGDMFLGFLHLMDNLAISRPEASQLMWSRDGLKWNRLPDRPHFMANGAAGEWDGGTIGSISLVPDREKVRIYYTGSNTRQAETRIPKSYRSGLAFMDKDRFLGLQAGPEGGYLLTREFVIDGNQLHINFKSGLKSPPDEWAHSIRAEIIRAPSDHIAATPVKGFSMDDCNPVTIKESGNYEVTWKNDADLSVLMGERVFIRFYLQNTTLYSFQIKR